MNSEELEQSLRTEFESSLKNVLADLRQEVAQLQEKVEAEFEKHKSQLDEVFRDFSARISTEKELDENFKETVVEHLRLARDEGARITATAIAEAEAMEKESAEAAAPPPSAGIGELRDAINDISNQNTQASILKALVQHAAQFTPRGAFFIIKNEHLVGWRVFGKEGYSDEKAVREVFFPVSLSTALGESVRSLSAVESSYGTYSDDSIYLNKLEFGQPDRMYAIPLVVRGRTVAVLYADYGNEGGTVNIDALETLARVASLTVEVLASARSGAKEFQTDAPHQPSYAREAASFEDGQSFENKTEPQPTDAAEENRGYEAEEYGEIVSEADSQIYETVSDSYSQPESEEAAAQSEQDFSVEEIQPETEYEIEYQSVDEENSWSSAAEEEAEQSPSGYSQHYETESDAGAQSDDFSPTTAAADEYQFETSQSYDSAEEAQFEAAPQAAESVQPDSSRFETSQFDASQFQTQQFEETQSGAAESFSPAQDNLGAAESQNGKTENYVAEPVEAVSEPVATAAQPVRTRFSDRNVDLPIEVGEEERRLHNDARRFARLLVSEIKLYNEQKVKEGREAGDLYERLREAIDRSREMYDKRVQPPVAARFDYFHYELVNTLAEGKENNLGSSYPGAAA